jgi:hypothetical protein
VDGSNENTNGLIRQYFPKRTNFKDITNKDLVLVLKKLNHRHQGNSSITRRHMKSFTVLIVVHLQREFSFRLVKLTEVNIEILEAVLSPSKFPNLMN